MYVGWEGADGAGTGGGALVGADGLPPYPSSGEYADGGYAWAA